MSEPTKSPAIARATEAPDESLLVLDMKKQKKKRIKDLRKGRGALMEEIKATIAELTSDGVVPKNSTPVVIVVREKTRNARPFRF